MNRMNLMDDFAMKTGIKGFSFARNSATKMEQFIWYCLIIIGSSLTAWDLSETFKNYMDKPTGTKVTVFHNETLDFGEPTLCLSFNTSYFNFGNIKSLNESQLTTFLTLFSNYWRNYSALVSQPNYAHFISMATEFISDIVRAEHQVNGNIHHSVFKFPGVIKDWLAQQNMSSRAFAYLTGSHLCREMLARVKRYDSETDTTITLRGDNEQLCVPERIVWLGVFPQTDRTKLCIRLPSPFFYFTNTLDSTIVQFDIDAFYMSSMSANDGDYQTLDFTSSEARLNNNENILWLPPQSSCVVSAFITGSYSRLPGLSVCSQKAKAKCLMECRYRFLRNWCGCSSIFDPSPAVSEYIECSSVTETPSSIGLFSSNNSRCHQIRLFMHPDTQCASKCQACHHKILSFYYIPVEKKAERNGSRLELFADRLSFIHFQEMLLISPRQFLAQVGGNLSFYLGANFLVIIHVGSFWLSECFIYSKKSIQKRLKKTLE